jgi:hypothetical protein
MTTPVKFTGDANGPEKFIPEFGCAVPTFTEKPGGDRPALTYHVPMKFRGDYRADQLANFTVESDYRTDNFGYVLCERFTKAGERCLKRARNRSPRCDTHGGRVHPLDKVVRQRSENENGPESSLSRYRQFLAGQIGVDDLDDEELATCGFRASNGRIYKPRNVPRELAQGFTKAIYERAQEELRALTVDAAKTVGEIMKNRTNEPDIRLKAAISLLERNLGKTPTNVVVTQEKPFEVIFDDITTERPNRQEPIDAEVVPERQDFDGANEIPSGTTTNGSGPIDGLDFDSSAEVVPEQEVGSVGTEIELVSNARMFERNEAILAQVIERKPFEYDLSDHREDVSKATKKRYASRALGVDLTGPNIPLVRIETRTEDGRRIIRHVDPDTLKIKGPNASDSQRRKTYTLNDF